MIQALSYLKSRLKERSSWMAIVAAIGVASALDFPWDVASAIAGTIAVLVPDGDVLKAKAE